MDTESVQHVTKDNPAGRLFHLLFALRELSGQGYDMWAQVLGIEVPPQGVGVTERDIFERKVFMSVFEVRILVDDVQRDLSRAALNGINVSPYVRILTGIVNIFSLSFLSANNYHDLFRPKVSEESLSLLELASDILSAQHFEVVVDEGDVADLLNQVRDLFEQTKTADIGSEKLRTFILDSLLKIENAIQQFRIRGAKPLEAALASVVGESVYLYGDAIAQAKQQPKARSWFERFSTVFARADVLLRFAETGQKAVATARRIAALLGTGEGA